MRSFRSSRALRLLLATLLLPAVLSAAQSPADTARVVSLMQADNLSYQATRSPSVWTIHFNGSARVRQDEAYIIGTECQSRREQAAAQRSIEHHNSAFSWRIRA